MQVLEIIFVLQFDVIVIELNIIDIFGVVFILKFREQDVFVDLLVMIFIVVSDYLLKFNSFKVLVNDYLVKLVECEELILRIESNLIYLWFVYCYNVSRSVNDDVENIFVYVKVILFWCDNEKD